MCLERRPHLAVQVCIVGDHPGDHLPRQCVLREPAQDGHGYGKDDDKYGHAKDDDTDDAQVGQMVLVIASMMTNMVYKLVMVITTMVTLMMLLLKRNLMVEKSSKTGGVSFTSSTVRRI